MFDVPVDTLPVWIGITLASVAVLGVSVSLPTTVPEATAVSGTIDSVAASQYAATGEHPVSAETVQLGTAGLTIVSGDGRAHASFAYGPITPVRRGTPLYRVLVGEHPAVVFDSPASFERAVERARDRAPIAVETDRLVVRHVTWSEPDVTLVGA